MLDVERWLAGTTSSADIEETKPEPDVFAVAMERNGLTPEHTIAVGDSLWDARAAARQGIEMIGVESGGTTAVELLGAGAAEVFAGPQEILDVLQTGPMARLLR